MFELRFRCCFFDKGFTQLKSSILQGFHVEFVQGILVVIVIISKYNMEEGFLNSVDSLVASVSPTPGPSAMALGWSS